MSNINTGLDWFTRSAWRYFPPIFVLSLAIRVDRLNQIPDRYLVPTSNWELGSIAISLMETGQFADPYMIPTGPTAHLPPIYPYIFSLIYRWFGLTATAGYASLLFIILSSSLLYAMLPWLAKKLGIGAQAGFIGGLGGALLVEWPGHGEYLTGLVMALLLIAFLQRWAGKRCSWLGSLLLGAAIGTAFHLQPALMTLILGCIAFELWWVKNPRKWAYLGVLVLGIALACLPWGWRNYTTFKAVFFIRSNFGLELRMGNHEGAVATMEVMDEIAEHIHPRTHFSEARKLREIGEIAYMRQAQEEALAWIRANPAEFLWLSVQRFANLWAGPLHRPEAAIGVSALTLLALLGAWRAFPRLTTPQQAACLIPLATYPLVYYFVAYMPRYRVPIDWVLFTLAGAAVWSFISPKRQRSQEGTPSRAE